MNILQFLAAQWVFLSEWVEVDKEWSLEVTSSWRMVRTLTLMEAKKVKSFEEKRKSVQWNGSMRFRYKVKNKNVNKGIRIYMTLVGWKLR